MTKLVMSLKEYLEIKELLDGMKAWISNTKTDIRQVKGSKAKITEYKNQVNHVLEDFKVMDEYADRLKRLLDYHYWQNKED